MYLVTKKPIIRTKTTTAATTTPVGKDFGDGLGVVGCEIGNWGEGGDWKGRSMYVKYIILS